MKGQNFAKGTLQRSWKEFWDSQGLSWLLGIIKKDQSYLSLSMWNESNSFAVHIYSVFSKVKYNQKMLGDHRNKPFKTELRVSQLKIVISSDFHHAANQFHPLYSLLLDLVCPEVVNKSLT